MDMKQADILLKLLTVQNALLYQLLAHVTGAGSISPDAAIAAVREMRDDVKSPTGGD